MSQEHAAYSSNKGHITAFETTDRELALDVASAIHNELEPYASDYDVRAHFEEHIDNPNERSLSYTRPDVGDFAVSVVLAETYEKVALSPNEPSYLLLAQTRNSAREIPSLNGPKRLQDALYKATKDILK